MVLDVCFCLKQQRRSLGSSNRLQRMLQYAHSSIFISFVNTVVVLSRKLQFSFSLERFTADITSFLKYHHARIYFVTSRFAV